MTIETLTPPSATPAFVSLLQEVHDSAGHPSLRTISRRIDQDYGYSVSPATISRMLAGKTKPTWENVRHFLLACGVAPHEVMSIWRRRFGQAEVPQPSSRAAEQGSGVSSGERDTCWRCGALAKDMALHAVWHGKAEAREQLLVELLDRATRERDDALQRLRLLHRMPGMPQLGQQRGLRVVNS